MKVYNISSKTTSINYIVGLIFFIFLILINFLAYGYSVEWHLSFESWVDWYFNIIKLIFNSNDELRWVYALLIFSPILFFILFIYEFFVRKLEIDKLNQELNLIYIDFKDDEILFKFNREDNDFSCNYAQISSTYLEICTRQAYSRYGWHSIVCGVIVEFNILDKGKYKLNNIPKDIYAIIKYLAKSKNFRYEITGSGYDIKDRLSKNMDEFLSNGFKKPNIHKQMSFFYLIFAIIFLVLGIITSFNGLFSLILDNHMWGLLVLPIIFFGVPIILLLTILNNR